jgi:hypothetical protein
VLPGLITRSRCRSLSDAMRTTHTQDQVDDNKTDHVLSHLAGLDQEVRSPSKRGDAVAWCESFRWRQGFRKYREARSLHRPGSLPASPDEADIAGASASQNLVRAEPPSSPLADNNNIAVSAAAEVPEISDSSSPGSLNSMCAKQRPVLGGIWRSNRHRRDRD